MASWAADTWDDSDEPDRAQDVIRCDLCDDTDPELYCNTCTKSLCISCTGKHASSRPLKKHDIVGFQYRNQMPSVINCARHQLFTCELFCKQCKKAVCSKCISSEYHQKHALTELSGVFQTKIKEIDNDLENIKTYILFEYNSVKTQLDNMSKIIPSRYKRISEVIRYQEEKWIQKIRGCAKTLLTKIEKAEAEHKEILNKEIRNVGKRLENEIHEKHTLTQLRKSQKSSLILEYQSNVKNLRIMPSRRIRSFLAYRPGLEILTCDGFGHLDITEHFAIPSYEIRFHIEKTASHL